MHQVREGRRPRQHGLQEMREGAAGKVPADTMGQMSCKHLNFFTNVAVNRIARSDDNPEIIAYLTEITIKCNDCDQIFEFVGVPERGLSYIEPMTNFDKTELRQPIKPKGFTMPDLKGAHSFTIKRI